MMDGQIHSLLVGRQIVAATKDGEFLLLHTNDDHIIKIAWRDSSGQRVKGEPELVSCSVRLVLPNPLPAVGAVGL